VLAQGAGPVTIVDSRIQGNHFGVLLNLNNVNNVMIRNSIISGNNVAGVFVFSRHGNARRRTGHKTAEREFLWAATAQPAQSCLRNSTIMGNSTGLTALLGSIVSFVNNAIYTTAQRRAHPRACSRNRHSFMLNIKRPTPCVLVLSFCLFLASPHAQASLTSNGRFRGRVHSVDGRDRGRQRRRLVRNRPAPARR